MLDPTPECTFPMAYLGKPGTTWILGQVEDANPVYYLKVNWQNNFNGSKIKSHTIETGLRSLFIDHHWRIVTATLSDSQNEVHIFFSCPWSRVPSVIELLLSGLQNKYQHIQNLTFKRIIQTENKMQPTKEVVAIISELTEVDLPTPLIITARNNIFYQPMVSRLTDVLTLTQDQKLSVEMIKKSELKKLTVPFQNENQVTEENFTEFLAKLDSDLKKQKEPPPSIRLTKQFLKAKRAFDNDHIDRAITLYEDILKQPSVSWEEQAEIHFELFCLHEDKNNYAKMISSLTNCYLLITTHVKKGYYATYWQNKLISLLMHTIDDYCKDIYSYKVNNKESLLGLLETYSNLQNVTAKAEFHSQFLQYKRSEVLQLFVTKIEAYCTQVRDEIESLLVIENDLRKGKVKGKDPLTEMLQLDFEYNPTYVSFEEEPPKREHYITHKTTVEQELEIDKKTQPEYLLFKNKKERYRTWACRHQQPSSQELSYGRLLFSENSKRFPKFNNSLLLPTKPAYQVNSIVNVHQQIAIRIFDDVLTKDQFEFYIKELFAKEDVIKQSIMQKLLDLRPAVAVELSFRPNRAVKNNKRHKPETKMEIDSPEDQQRLTQ